ncbi:MAG: sodium:solute symporter family protein [Planctomycetes bacterium]|nr:sodium:solute symporter family protein [Planctomycetota bacterium]
MNNELMPFTTGELAFIGAYLASLLVIGWLGLKARKEQSLSDFYLGGKGIGLFVLVLTLYATQYSGNSMFGYTGKAYRIGFPWMMSVHFMTAIVVFYLMLAPRLHALSKKQGFITPTDYLQHRFNSPAINIVATVVMLVAIANYLLAQMMAMGRALQGLMPQQSHNAYVYGVILLALIIVVYETMGGFRAVAWTDMIQGSILLVGLFVLLGLVCYYIGTPATATQKLLASGPDGVAKIVPPDAARCREWLSYVVVVGIGGALYPQAIQRIYAARSAMTLRRSLAAMAFLPMTACLITVLVGVIAAAYEPGLKDAESDKILTVICRQIQQQSLFGRWFVVVLFAAILAAVMSTADSVLLSISSMLTKDLYGRFARPHASQRELALVGKICSWATIAIVVHLAIICRDKTLMQILDRKFDILVQLGPAFFLGLHWRKLRPGPTLLGLVVGVGLAVTLALCGHGKIYGVHAGIYGLGANLLIVFVGTGLARRR